MIHQILDFLRRKYSLSCIQFAALVIVIFGAQIPTTVMASEPSVKTSTDTDTDTATDTSNNSKYEKLKESASDEPENHSRSSADHREKRKAAISATLFSFGIWLPYKYGFKGTYNLDRDYTLEAEYLSASLGIGIEGLQLGGFSERLLMININGYRGSNSFHWITGIGQRRYQFFLGDELTSDIVGAATGTDLSLVKVESNFINLGFANSWILDNQVQFGVDWINLIIPFGDAKVQASFLDYGTDSDSLSTVRTILRILGDTPTFSILKFHIGYSF